ncbi:unannotated protein [freshwater metagenome]|uniref:Unannotated protein n=1 Tax=freshwater metagenome TaxID=449393 RepID=A0A6J6AX84_9ZZZZ
MRADGWVAGCGSLLDRERSDLAVYRLDLASQRVDSCGFEPKLAPLVQIATAGHLKFGQQVSQGRVFEFVFLEVGRNALNKCLTANSGTKLAQHGGSLCIGDSVEVHLNILEVANFGNNRVGARQLVLGVGPGLLAERKSSPRVGPLGGFGNGKV